MDDDLLLEKIRKGDDESFYELYHRYVEKVFHYINLQVGDYHLAEELTQEVFIKVVKGLHGFRQESKLHTWIFAISRNVVTDEMRRRSRRKTTYLPEEELERIPQEGYGSEPAQHLLEKDTRAELSLGLQNLSEEQRSVLYFRYEAGFSLEETSRLMKRSVSAIKSLQWRAVNKLKQVLKQEVIE